MTIMLNPITVWTSSSSSADIRWNKETFFIEDSSVYTYTLSYAPKFITLFINWLENSDFTLDWSDITFYDNINYREWDEISVSYLY